MFATVPGKGFPVYKGLRGQSISSCKITSDSLHQIIIFCYQIIIFVVFADPFRDFLYTKG